MSPTTSFSWTRRHRRTLAAQAHLRAAGGGADPRIPGAAAGTRRRQPEAMMVEVEWWRLKAGEINALAARDAVVIVPVGSTEQHGPHLPTQVDACWSGEVARRAARRIAATDAGRRGTDGVERPRRASHEPRWHSFAGLPAFFALLQGLCRSLVRAGIPPRPDPQRPRRQHRGADRRRQRAGGGASDTAGRDIVLVPGEG